MNNKRFIPFLVLAVLFSACKVQKKSVVGNEVSKVRKPASTDTGLYISSINTNYILKDSNQVIVYVDMQIDKGEKEVSKEDLAKAFRTSWALQSASGIKEKFESGKIDFMASDAKFVDGRVRWTFNIPRLKEHAQATLGMDFVDLKASRKFVHESLVDFNTERPNHLFALYLDGSSSASFKTYFQKGEVITLKSMDEASHDLILVRYSAESPPALSPMSTSKREELSSFTEVETRHIKSNEKVLLDKEGTYVLYVDQPEPIEGFGFLVADERYPRLAQVDKLLEPLVYMSTNEEIKELKGAEDFKKSMDLYFLKLSEGKTDLAKRIIRAYYRRVQKANELFSNYKDGWKTDKGMIYTVLGPPTRIQRNGLREVWMYAQSGNFNEIIFTFYNKPNPFSEDHYELVRYPEYAAYWFPFVEAWRTGKILE
ncbi:GWxTD domain-containing protein [Marinilongibacter aquaticus]|uniref:GWxTD domain-containing protein n=1 Tax=Marinilongibacter aquaticus TaxID=2975157 RepID=UPI0021BD3CF8|nr:GWxTD domain-containing protein [Marinilongibacter aquaticus]UBM60317.1 GWxTD domain-containing protein [Marinilongibacter aquaticus]